MMFNEQENPMPGGKVQISGECIFCNKTQIVVCNAKAYARYCNGTALIQDALPELSAAQRELLISGVCETCFDCVTEEK